jgi:hypothetical protein
MDAGGKLMGFELHEVIWICTTLKKSGLLQLTSPNGTGHIGFSEGQLVETVCPGTPQLGELLLKHNFISKENLIATLQEQKNSPDKKFLGEILISKNILKAEMLTKLLEIQSYLALKTFLKWSHILYEFSPAVKKQDEKVSISFHGIEPLQIFQRIEQSGKM